MLLLFSSEKNTITSIMLFISDFMFLSRRGLWERDDVCFFMRDLNAHEIERERGKECVTVCVWVWVCVCVCVCACVRACA